MSRKLWQDDTVAWFRAALAHSRFPALALDVLRPLLRPDDTVLDVGCGPGTLSVPLAPLVRGVTALDSNPAMIAALCEEKALARADNVTPLEGDWREIAAQLAEHDVLLAANVAPVVRDLDAFLPAAHAIARRWVVVILGAGPRENKFFQHDLRALLGLPQSPPRGDYLEQYAGLHARGVYANVHILEYDFGQPFADWPEAVAFHRAHLGLETTEHDATIEAFLREHLEERPEGPYAPMPKRSAVMWWAPPRAS